MVACVAPADAVGMVLDGTVDDASGVALGAFAVVPAHPTTTTERIAAAMSRIADIITESERARGKTSLKAYDRVVQPPELKRNRTLVYWATAVLIILVIVMVILLFASRAT
jgi:hypothetical protein